MEPRCWNYTGLDCHKRALDKTRAHPKRLLFPPDPWMVFQIMGDLILCAPFATTCQLDFGNRGTEYRYMATKQYALAAGICMEKLWVREGIVGLRTWNNERRVRYAERALAGVPLTAADHAGDAYIYFYMPYASKSLVPTMRH